MTHPTPWIGGVLFPPFAALSGAPAAPAAFAPAFPAAQAHDQTGGIVALGADLGGVGDDVAGALLGGAGLLDDVDDLLVHAGAADAVADQHQEGVLAGFHLGAADLRLGAHAHALGSHVAEAPRVSEPAHALFAKRVGHEGGRPAAQPVVFGRRGRVVVGGERDGDAVRGAAEEDAGVAAVGGDEGGGGGRVPEWCRGGGGDERDRAG